MVSAEAYTDGSPLDAAVFGLLIIAGALVLYRRQIDWTGLLTENRWIWLYFLYCGISITWADDPFVSLKRWVKELGNPIMVLVILTDKRPVEAVGAVLRRLAFLWLPLSVLFVRYFPDLGRVYAVGGQPMYTGVGHQKNDLGLMCMICGIYFVWNFLSNQKEGFKLVAKGNITDVVFLCMIAYLLYMAQSATSLTCLVVAASLLFVGRMPSIAREPGRIVTLLAILVPLVLVLDATLGVRDLVYGVLGRDATLTNRTSVWEVVKGMAVNPIVGAGFMSFWSGDRLTALWKQVGLGTNQAHNGYLEQYVNLGYIGVTFIGGIILSGLLKVRKRLNVQYSLGVLQLCFIITAILYNYTEASFYGINNMWLLLLFGTIGIPDRETTERAWCNGRSSLSC